MEKILHRANAPTQLQTGRLYRVDRLEADIHATRNGFAVTHDRPFGPFVAGRRGVVDSATGLPLLRRKGRLMRLSSLLGQPRPLYLDLKGRWSDTHLSDLALEILARERDDIIVASLNLDLVDRFAAIAPEIPVMYTLKRREQFIRLHQKPVPRAFVGITVNAMAYNRGRDAKTVIGQMHNQDLLAFAWNIPDEETAHILSDHGLDGAIIDDPSWNW